MNSVRTRKEETRARILETAVRLFQAKGVDGVGVDEIMRESGLTHGGFYAHFENKEALVAEACVCAIDATLEDLREAIVKMGDDETFGKGASRFLSGDPRTDGPACAMAMLGPEVARRAPVQEAYAKRVRHLIKQIAQDLDCSEEDSILTLSAVVGATALAAQISADASLARQIVDSVRQGLLRCREMED